MILQPTFFTVFKATEWDHRTLSGETDGWDHDTSRNEADEQDDRVCLPETGEIA